MPSDYEAFRPELCYLKQSLESTYATGSLAGSRIPVEQQSRAEQIALLSYTRCYKTLSGSTCLTSHMNVPPEPLNSLWGVSPLSEDVRNVPPASTRGAPRRTAAAHVNPVHKCTVCSWCLSWSQSHCRRVTIIHCTHWLFVREVRNRNRNNSFTGRKMDFFESIGVHVSWNTRKWKNLTQTPACC